MDGMTTQEIQEIPKHKKRAPRNKPYVIEWRCIAFNDWLELNRWSTYRRYPTLEKAQQALVALMQSHRGIKWEFRLKDQ